MTNEIFRILLIILVMEGIFVYILLFPPTDVGAKLSLGTQSIIVRIFAILIIIGSLFGFYSFFYDSVIFFKKGESYLKKTECVVQNVTTFTILPFMKKNIICNNKRFINYFTFNSYYEEEKFSFTYLPKSNILIKAELLDSPYKKRLNEK